MQSTTRYADLHCPSDVLVVELGWGEPDPPTFLGATKNPQEWMTRLEQDGRSVSLFLLWISRDLTVARKTGKMDPLYAALAHERYMPDRPCSSVGFLSRLQTPRTETVIDTSSQDVQTTAAQVMRSAGVES
jgi:hypothetical protein